MRAVAIAGSVLALGVACGGAPSGGAPPAPHVAKRASHTSVGPVESMAPVPASSNAASVDAPAEHAPDEPAGSAASAEPEPAEVASASASAPSGPVCNPQKPFPFLIRKNYIPVSVKKQAHEKALRFRATTYGSVQGIGDPSWNPTLAKSQVVSTTVFGLPVSVHKKIVPALACVEAEIEASCGATPYTPAVLAGIRDHNTYRGGEVTNHLFGIAIDLDPLLNSCCGCTTAWQASPLCKKKVKTIWERMSMPKCWVDAFEKYGFYWLGHDRLQDTMHFEFLADPDKILSGPATSVAKGGKPAVVLAQAGVDPGDDDPYADDLPPVDPPDAPEPTKAKTGSSEAKTGKSAGKSTTKSSSKSKSSKTAPKSKPGKPKSTPKKKKP